MSLWTSARLASKVKERSCYRRVRMKRVVRSELWYLPFVYRNAYWVMASRILLMRSRKRSFHSLGNWGKTIMYALTLAIQAIISTATNNRTCLLGKKSKLNHKMMKQLSPTEKAPKWSCNFLLILMKKNKSKREILLLKMFKHISQILDSKMIKRNPSSPSSTSNQKLLKLWYTRSQTLSSSPYLLSASPYSTQISTATATPKIIISRRCFWIPWI